MFFKTNKTVVILIGIILVFSFGVMASDYNEAPALQEKVAEGDLPPVEERLPDTPYVVEPNEEIGEYGGTLNVTTNWPDSWGEDLMLMDIFCGFVKPGPEASEVLTNFAKKIDSSEDMTTYTIHLREGVKWSDGEPYDAEDVMFWYEDVLLNEELTPVIGVAYKADGEVLEMEKIDDYTIQIKFAAPKPFFPHRLTHMDINYPKHYLKQFHPHYTSQEKLEEMVEEEGYDNWYELFENKNLSVAEAPMVTDLPTLAAYRLVEKDSNRRIFERNPYYWKVDSEGNQLPYIGRIRTEVIANEEILSGKIISGEVDFAGFSTNITDYPMYKNYEDRGSYKTYLWQEPVGDTVGFQFNMTSEDEDLRKIFQDLKFRKAMSLALDRDEINEAIFYDKATPRQASPIPTSRYFEPEFAESYVENDPEKANELLDEMGLDEKNSQGIRLMPNGEKLTFTMEVDSHEYVTRATVSELAVEYWREIGVDVQLKSISGELRQQRFPANLADATAIGHRGDDILFPIDPLALVPSFPRWEEVMWTEWSRWFESEGDEGEEPPAEIKELRSWWEQMLVEPDEQKQIELGKNIYRSTAENLWSIGTVGMPPYPITLKKNLINFPKEGLWHWSTLWSTTRNPEQVFFKE